MRVLLIEPAGGCSGDMLLAALLDAGAPEDVVRGGLAALGLPGFRLDVSRASKAGIHGTRVDVEVIGEDAGERDLGDIRPMLRRLPSGAGGLALRVFEALAAAEAKIHDTTPDRVHFHEVGAVDSIVDIAGAALALDALGCDRVHATAPPMGTGIARSRHGPIPVPAPATLELLRGRPVRAAGEGERTTPTGAAFLAALTLADPLATIVPERVGYGIGHRDFPDAANVLRATVGRTGDAGEELVEIACNLDDATPQVIARALDAALIAGALDAWVAPVTMKKGRPGHVLAALAPASLRAAITELLLRETPTLGVRFHAVSRDVLERRFETVATQYGEVRIKIGHRGAEVLGATPEWEDCLAAAAAHGVPPARVRDEALAAWLAAHPR